MSFLGSWEDRIIREVEPGKTMPQEQWVEVIQDDAVKSFCIVSEASSDDTRLTDLTSEMINLGMEVHCHTIPVEKPLPSIKRDFAARGLTEDDGLYGRLLKEKGRREMAKKRSPQ